MRERDFKKYGLALAKKRGWRFIGHFYPAENDVTMLNFELPSGIRTVIALTGAEQLTLTGPQITAVLNEKADEAALTKH